MSVLTHNQSAVAKTGYIHRIAIQRYRLVRVFLFCTCAGLLIGCNTTPVQTSAHIPLATWLAQADSYQRNLAHDHPDKIENILRISEPMQLAIDTHFSHLPQSKVSSKLAAWLISDDGHAMAYDVESNLIPAQAFENRRGNCLSFTILLTTMAAELGVTLRYNEVDLPDVWDQGENDDDGLILYRHINAVRQSSNNKFVFDLAMDEYDPNYPQRIIPTSAAIALLHNNKAIEGLKNNDIDSAFHYIKLALALNPSNADIFVNLGVIFKANQQYDLAEQALLHALKVDKNSTVAASKLERWYRNQGKLTKAKRYERLARASHARNPYFQFAQAKRAYKSGEYKAARRQIKRAKYLHEEDSRFFALSSRIEQALQNYNKAALELETAYNLAKTAEQRQTYNEQARQLGQIMKDLIADRTRQGRKINHNQNGSALPTL